MARARRRHRVRGAPLRRARGDDRRGRLHDDLDRLPGGPDRSLVLRADRHDDGAGDRQRRRQLGGHRGGRRTRRASRASSCATRARSRRTGALRSRSTPTSRATASSGSRTSTRDRLTRHLRDHGSQNGAIGTDVARGAGPARPRGPGHERARPRALGHAQGAVRVDRRTRGLDDRRACAPAGAPRRGPRLRHQDEHPAVPGRLGVPAHGGPRHVDAPTTSSPCARRHLRLERPRRSRRPSATRSRRSEGSSARSRSSASASGTSSSRWRSAPGRTSSSSGTAAPTSPSRT